MKKKIILLNLESQKQCAQYLMKVRWNNIPTCTHCGSIRNSPKGKRFTCLGCGKSYSILVGTVFESTKISLYKWFQALEYMLISAKGISSCQLAKYIGVHRNTAWRMQFKIRNGLRSRTKAIRFIYKDLKARLKSDNIHDVLYTVKSFFQIKNKGASIQRHLTYLMNRGVVGQYHKISVPHLQSYIDEMIFRQTHKKHSDLGLEILIIRLLNKDLPFSVQ